MQEIPGMGSVPRKGGPPYDIRLQLFGRMLLRMDEVVSIEATDPEDPSVIVRFRNGEAVQYIGPEAAALRAYMARYADPDERIGPSPEAAHVAAATTIDRAVETAAEYHEPEESPVDHWREGSSGG